MQIEHWPIEKILPYPKNARKIPESAVLKVAASIREFGWAQPIVVDASGVIVIGHVRRLAALHLGLATVPVFVARDLSPEKIRALRLADNRTHDEAKWDLDLLAPELIELKGLIDLGSIGFDSRELDKLLRTDDDRADDAPPVPAVPVTQSGDLWLLGDHRLLCGDSTSASDVERLLGEARPFLMVTDPPYGVEYDPEWRNRSSNLAYRATSTAYMREDLEAAWLEAHKLFNGDVAYVWHADRPALQVAGALVECGFEIRNQIVWCKEAYAISRGHYNPQHECCFYAVRKGKSANWKGGNSQSTFWKVNRMDGQPRTGHAAQKPVEIMRRPIENHTESGDSVYEPFLGSGTTLIAAETRNRKCLALELDPAYCDVAVMRWQNLTGKSACLESGETFDSVAASRKVAA